MQEIIKPTDENHWLQLRTEDVTSTESAALFGCSPYITKYQLWHRKKGRDLTPFKENERMKWGTRLQDSIAEGICEEKNWDHRRKDEYIRIPELRMGASFDFEVKDIGCEAQTGLLEVKNVDSLQFRDGWIESDDDVEAPPHIEIQVQHQLAVSGLPFAYLGALVGGNKLVLMRREPQTKVIEALKSKIAEFWKSIDDGVEPEFELPQDAKFIAKLYAYSTPGSIISLEGDAEMLEKALKYSALGKTIKALTSERESIKAEFLQRIGDAEKVIGGEYKISAGTVGPAEIAYHRDGYRMFKLTVKKVKP